jgi:hypothetical protein
MKRDFFGRYWPHIEIVGTFHSHPYESLQEVRELRGWQSSPEDTDFWPKLHKELCVDAPYLAHLIVTITALQRASWAYPKRIENGSGFELGSDRRKLWVMSYGTARVEEDDETEYSMIAPTHLDIPALENRFWENT